MHSRPKAQHSKSSGVFICEKIHEGKQYLSEKQRKIRMLKKKNTYAKSKEKYTCDKQRKYIGNICDKNHGRERQQENMRNTKKRIRKNLCEKPQKPVQKTYEKIIKRKIHNNSQHLRSSY